MYGPAVRGFVMRVAAGTNAADVMAEPFVVAVKPDSSISTPRPTESRKGERERDEKARAQGRISRPDGVLGVANESAVWAAMVLT